MKRMELTRREVLARLGGGVLVLAFAHVCVAQNRNQAGQGTDRIAAWLHIGPDGKVTVFTGKVEVGQDIRTSLTQAVAEELRLPMEAIELVMGDTDRVPFDQGTFGSRTTPTMTPTLRRAGRWTAPAWSPKAARCAAPGKRPPTATWPRISRSTSPSATSRSPIRRIGR